MVSNYHCLWIPTTPKEVGVGHLYFEERERAFIFNTFGCTTHRTEHKTVLLLFQTDSLREGSTSLIVLAQSCPHQRKSNTSENTITQLFYMYEKHVIVCLTQHICMFNSVDVMYRCRQNSVTEITFLCSVYLAL